MPDPAAPGATAPYDALLLVSFGGPEKPADVMPFLENVTRGRGIPPERLDAVAEQGGASLVGAGRRDRLQHPVRLDEADRRDLEPEQVGDAAQDRVEGVLDGGVGEVIVAPNASDVDELEDHLREQVADLRATGLDDDEAFLVAIKRMGNLDAVSHEFAREHSERLWKQLVLLPEDAEDAGAPPWRELGIVLALAVGAGLAVKAGTAWLGDEAVLARNLGLLVLPFLADYFAWKRRLTARVVAALLLPFALLAVVLNVYPFVPGGSTELLAVLHAPVALWLWP